MEDVLGRAVLQGNGTKLLKCFQGVNYNNEKFALKRRKVNNKFA